MLFLILTFLSCSENNSIDEFQTCPNIEVIANEPIIIEYSETIDWQVKPYKYFNVILSNKIQKTTYLEMDVDINDFIPKNEYLYIYNNCGFLEKIEEYNIHNNNEFIRNRKEYEYDNKGRLISLFENGNLINYSGDNLPTFEYMDNTVSYKQKYQTNGQKSIGLTFNNNGFITDYIEYAELFGSTRITRYKYAYDSKNKLINTQKLEENGNWIIGDTFTYSDIINPIGILQNRMFGRQNNTLLNCFYFGPEFASRNHLDEFLYMTDSTEIIESQNGVAIRFYNYEFLIE